MLTHSTRGASARSNVPMSTRSVSRVVALTLSLGLALPLPVRSAPGASLDPKLGLDKWIELQLQPERIPEPDVARRLEPLATQRLATGELVRKYDLPPEA